MTLIELVSTAIIPVVVLLAAGFIINRKFLPQPELWNGLEKLIYFVFTPALFISSISTTDLSAFSLPLMALSLVVPICVMAAVVFILRRPMRATGPDVTSLIQGAIRMNTYMGLIICQALAGAPGVAAFALACAVVVPTVNIISVWALSVYGDSPDRKRPSVLKALSTNPFLVSCLVGIALNLAPFELPAVVATPLELLASPAMVIGTLISGAALKFSLSRKATAHVVVACVLKLLVLPVGTALFSLAVGLAGPALIAVVVITAIPTAPSAYILARIMGGNAPLMAAITGAQTVVSMATLPVILLLFAV